MQQYDPLGFVPQGQELNKAIIAFASEQGLGCDPLWHELPVWRIYEPQFSEGRQRHLQVCAYQEGRVHRLSITWSVNIAVDDPNSVAVAKTAKNVERPSIRDVMTNNRISRAKLNRLLLADWEKTANLQYHPDELMVVERRDA